MNLHFAVTSLIFLVSTASANNLRDVQQHKRFLKPESSSSSSSSSSDIDEFRAVCIIRSGCDVNEDTLKKAAERAIDDYNESSSSSSSSSCDGHKGCRRLSSKNDNDKTFTFRIADDDCSKKDIEREIKDDLSSSSNSHSHSKRLRHLKESKSSSSSSSGDDAELKIRCIREDDLSDRILDNCDLDDITEKIVRNSDFRRRRLSDADVEIVSREDIRSLDMGDGECNEDAVADKIRSFID